MKTKAGPGVKYVVPQRLKKDGKDKKLFFRAIEVTHDSRTQALCGRKTVAAAKRQKCAPGEMENLTVKGGDIRADITVRIGEG